MKILHVLPSLSPSWGGPVSAVLGLVPALERQGVQSRVLATYGPTTGAKPLLPADLDATVFLTNTLGRWWIGCAPALGRRLREEIDQFDLIHIHELWHYPYWIAARLASARGQPYVISPRGELSAWALQQKVVAKRLYAPLLLRPALRQVSTVHALSHAEVQQIRDFGVDAPVAIIPNGVPAALTRLDRDKGALLARFPELVGKSVALFLGRLRPQKGPDVLVDAWPYVQHQVPSAHLLLAGPGAPGAVQPLEARLDELGVRSSVTIAGPLFGEAKLDVLSGADVFVLPSRSEGQSNALLEAMAAGLPVVVTPAGNIPDVASARAGLVSPLEPAQLGQSIAGLLADASLARQMGKHGRTLVAQKYTWDYTAKPMVELYGRCVEKARR